MGLFHCPIGAAYYDDDACIDCGLCNAVTSGEKVEASKKVREYIRSHAIRNTRVSKIAVCGKGGSGKSSITALLAQAFAEAGYSVIVLDSDDSNSCLARMLGIDGNPLPLGDLFSGTEEQVESRMPERAGGLSIDDLPAGYIKSRDGIRFISTGKIFDPFQGCACSLAESARRILEKIQAGDKEVLILDTEAGVESFGRGVERDVDAVLAIVEPSFGSIELAGRIADMAQGMGIRMVRAVLNKVSDTDMQWNLVQRMSEKGVQTLGTVKQSRLMAEASLEGRPLLLQLDAGIHEALAEIAAGLMSTPVPDSVK